MARELLMAQNSFQWEAIEGQTLEIENAIKSNARNLLVEGKTFNNIYKMENIKFTSTGTGGLQELKSDGYFYLNKIASDRYCDITQDLTLPITSNTTYTLVVDIRTNTLTGSMDFNADYMDRSWFLESAPLPAGTTGRKMYKLTSKSVLPMHESARPLRTQLSPSVEGILEYKVILLEGDYTNSYAPSNINGIESVAEREKEGNLYPVKIAQSNNETDGIVLPNGVTNTIENGVHVKNVGKYKITGNENWEYRNQNDNFYKLHVTNILNPISRIDFQNSKSFLICNNIPVEYSVSEIKDNLYGLQSKGDGSGFIVSIPKSELTEFSVNSAKEWLKNKNATVWYELANPITEPLSLTEVNIPIPLRSLPNGVCDEVVGNKLIQRVYELKLDENFNFSKSVKMGTAPTDTSLWRIDIDLSITTVIGNQNSVISNMFPYLFIHNLPGGLGSVTQECITNHSANKIAINIIIKRSRLTSLSVDGFKEWCIANDFKILYQLETPIEHTINVPRVPIAKGSNIITTTNNIKPNLSMKYKRKK